MNIAIETKALSDKDFKGWYSRAMSAPKTMRKEGKSSVCEAVITTEKAAEVIDWDRWEMVREILLMKGCQLPENKQVPLLNAHSRWSTSSVRGSIRNLRIEGDQLIGDVYFWSKAEDEISQVEEGHLTDLSVGYKISDIEEDTIEVKPGKEAQIDDKKFVNDSNMRLLIRLKWWPKEGSMVPIGADDASKFRSAQQPGNPEDENLQRKVEEIVNKKIISLNLGERTMGKENTQGSETQTEELSVEKRAEIEVDRRMGIEKVSSTYGKNYKPGETKLKEVTDQAIKEKWSVEMFKAHLFDNFDSTKSVQTPLTDLDLTGKQREEYSLLEGINHMLDGSFGQGKSGLVKEASDEIAKRLTRLGVMQHDKSFFVPNDYWGKSLPQTPFGFDLGQRAMDATTVGAGTGGSNLVGTQFRGDLFIELLRSKLALGQAGVSMLTGLKENITIPKQLTDGTFAIASEGIAGVESALTFDQIDGAPNIGTGWQEFTKLLLLQGNPSIEALVRDSLLAVATRGIDRYGIVGGGNITGLLNETGVNPIQIASGDPAWADIVAFETAIEAANAAIGEIKWLMPPYIKGRAKTIPKLAGSQFSGWLMETNGDMNGYSSVISTLVPAYYLIFGVFKQMWLASWGAVEIQANPFIKLKEGIVQIVIFAYFDWLVRQPTAFAISDDVTES